MTAVSRSAKRVLRMVMVGIVALGLVLSGVGVRRARAAEIAPNISNLTQTQVANTWRLSFDFDFDGVAAAAGDTFTVTLPPELQTANAVPFNVTQGGVVVGEAVPSGDRLVVTFNEHVQGNSNGRGSIAFNVTLVREPGTGETITSTVTVGNESVVITKQGTGPTPFESIINKYNQTGTHVTKSFKLGADKNYFWVNTGRDYLSQWHIRFNGDGTKADLSNIVVSDKMGGQVVTDYSGITFSGGIGTSTPDPASLFHGPYVVDSFSLVRNGAVVASGAQVADHIRWSNQGFTLSLSDVDPSFSTPSQDTIVLSYMTLIPYGTSEIHNTASYTSDQNTTPGQDGASWQNATGEAVYDGDVTVSATKRWVGPAAGPVTVEVVASTDEHGTADGLSYGGETWVAATWTLDEAGGWTASSSMPATKRYAADVSLPIRYTVRETNVPAGYTAAVTGDAASGFTITNTSTTPATTSVRVSKAWADDGDRDGVRPSSVTVRLLADGVETGRTLTLDASNGWSAAFTGLPKKSAGRDIAYTVSEDAVDGYTAAVTGDAASGFTVTNTHEPAETLVSVDKRWDDDDDRDGIRPASVTVHLHADGVDTGRSATLDASNGWTALFSSLPKYDSGREISYTVSEDPVPGYTARYSESVSPRPPSDGADPDVVHNHDFIVWNTHEPETVSVPVTKMWDDDGDRDGLRPDSVTVRLIADGADTGRTLTLDAASGWTGSFEGLLKNEDGREIAYTVEEDAVPGYEARYDGFTITNRRTPQGPGEPDGGRPGGKRGSRPLPRTGDVAPAALAALLTGAAAAAAAARRMRASRRR